MIWLPTMMSKISGSYACEPAHAGRIRSMRFSDFGGALDGFATRLLRLSTFLRFLLRAVALVASVDVVTTAWTTEDLVWREDVLGGFSGRGQRVYRPQTWQCRASIVEDACSEGLLSLLPLLALSLRALSLCVATLEFSPGIWTVLQEAQAQGGFTAAASLLRHDARCRIASPETAGHRTA